MQKWSSMVSRKLTHGFVTEFPFSYLSRRQSYKTFLCWAKMSHSKSSINFLCAAESLHWIGRSKFSASYKWKQYIHCRQKCDIISCGRIGRSKLWHLHLSEREVYSDKPARFIIRLLFAFASESVFVKLHK